jgi:signal transduction histidine kinase
MLSELARWITVVLFAVLAGLVAPAQATTTLTHASVTVEHGAATAPSAARDVSLPNNWDATQGGASGRARYVLRFATEEPAIPHALFISRVGNTFRIELNGTLLGAKGIAGDPYADFSKQPQFFAIPPEVLKTDNTLVITIDAQSGRRAGLSDVVVGRADEVGELFETAYRWRVDGFLVLSMISTVLGSFALLLWLRQREMLFVFYGVSELTWAMLVSDTLFERTPLPWPWWGIVVFSCYALAASLICKFTLILLDRHQDVMKRISDWHLLLTLPAVAIAFVTKVPVLLSVWLGLTLVLCIVVAVLAVRDGIRSSVSEKRVLAFAVIATCVAASRDMIVFRILPGYGGVPWSRYAWVAFGITLAWIIAERMRKSTVAIARMNQTLVQRLAEREAELNASYALQAEVERNQVMTEERQRLTRDMHDGLGSQLLGALHLAQNHSVSREVLTEQLRETLDHLKLTVDAMQDTEGDIAALLGALRYRLGPRLDAAGIRLDWSVEPLPAIAGWTLQHSRDVQMILFEAFSNIMTHARATNACLHAALDEQRAHICITLRDNGAGFSTEDKGGGKGLANMQARAVRLGAALHIGSSSNGTEVRLSLLADGIRPLRRSTDLR